MIGEERVNTGEPQHAGVNKPLVNFGEVKAKGTTRWGRLLFEVLQPNGRNRECYVCLQIEAAQQKINENPNKGT